MKKVNVATKETVSFNTASGRCCCNSKMISIWSTSNVKVSIPQAVGAVATGSSYDFTKIINKFVSIPQAVGAVATYGWSKLS